MKSALLPEILQLSVDERILLVQEIWDSVAVEDETLPVTAEQRDELDRRLARLEVAPNAGSSWGEVKARILDGQ